MGSLGSEQTSHGKKKKSEVCRVRGKVGLEDRNKAHKHGRKILLGEGLCGGKE